MGSGSSGIRGGRAGGSSTTMTIDQKRKAIDNTGFKNLGGGNWDLDIPGIGGAQILDETGSSRAIRAGFMPNQKAYAYSVWDDNGTQLTNLATQSVYIVDSLNTAKDYAKRILKRNL